MIPPVDPAAVEKTCDLLLANGNYPNEVAVAQLRALSSALTQAQARACPCECHDYDPAGPHCGTCDLELNRERMRALTAATEERDALADSIHPKRARNAAWWGVKQLCSLAAAHREDSESVDRASDVSELRDAVIDWDRLAVERQTKLAKAHQHLGTALDAAGYHTHDLDAARAYYEAHKP